MKSSKSSFILKNNFKPYLTELVEVPMIYKNIRTFDLSDVMISARFLLNGKQLGVSQQKSFEHLYSADGYQ